MMEELRKWPITKFINPFNLMLPTGDRCHPKSKWQNRHLDAAVLTQPLGNRLGVNSFAVVSWISFSLASKAIFLYTNTSVEKETKLLSIGIMATEIKISRAFPPPETGYEP